MSGGMGRDTRTACAGRRSRSVRASWPSPMRSRRSSSAARTARRGPRRKRSTSCGASRATSSTRHSSRSSSTRWSGSRTGSLRWLDCPPLRCSIATSCTPDARSGLSVNPRGGTGGVPSPPGRLKYDFVWLGLRILMSCYVRVRVVGGDRLPDSGYLVCFNHPSWLDPLVLAGFWPDRRPLFIFGPRERDMAVGRGNRLIVWSGRGVPFKPGGVDLLDTSRRAVGVLAAGGVLAVAGEGRLSDGEGEALPLQEGVAYFAIHAGAPIVPAGIVGTRWVHFGKR